MFGIGETISNALRELAIRIDSIVYWFVEVILQLIMDLSKVEIFTQTTINTFAKRIYIILGLIMVFKMMISFIQILIDPDTITDKEKGAGAILKRVVIALVLIVLIPSIFSTARKIQSYVLPIIPRVIMGVTVEENDDGVTTESKIGRLMAWYSFLPFFDYAGTCNDGSIMSYDAESNDSSNSNITISSVAEAANNINRQDKSCGAGEYHYMYEHKFLISTVVGVYLAFTLVTVAVQVAIRAIKFGICEFIAPIPIASYIDPKTSKQTFDKWVSTSIKVYLDLFIQLIVVYFVAFIFQIYFADGNNFKIIVANTGGSFWRAALVYLFIIIGLISFIKQFPKFLSDLLGLNTGGAIGEIFKGAWTTARETAGFANNLRKAAVSNWSEMSNTQYANGSKPNAARKLASVVGGLGGIAGHTIAGKLKGKNGSELTKLAFDKTTGNRDERIATRNRRLSGYTRKMERDEKRRERLHISSKDSWAETKYREHSALANLMSDAGALGLKKGEEVDYTIDSDISGTNLAAKLGSNSLKYTALKKIAEMKEGDTWDGHALSSTMINEAADYVKKQQKLNKMDHFARLIAGNDAGAIEIRNKIEDTLKSSPVYNDTSEISKFADSIFGTGDKIELDYAETDPNGRVIGITTKEFKKSEFSREKLIELAEHCLVDTRVQATLKNVAETERNTAQAEAAEASRRSKASNEAKK